jgi:hypothetical protein
VVHFHDTRFQVFGVSINFFHLPHQSPPYVPRGYRLTQSQQVRALLRELLTSKGLQEGEIAVFPVLMSAAMKLA